MSGIQTIVGRFKTALGSILVSAAAWLAAADAAVALSRGWRPANLVDWLIIVCGFVGTAALGLLTLRSTSRAYCRSHAAELILLGCVLAVSLMSVELILRKVRLSPEVQFHHAPPNLSVTVSADGDVKKRKFSTNSLGIRGPELTANSTYRMLCIGGSTTQCYYLDDFETWTHLLMVELNDRLSEDSVWVGAVGLPGYTTAQHLRYVQTNPTLNQYTHLVFLFGVNDLLNWLSFKRRNAPRDEAPAPPAWHRLAIYQRATALLGDAFDPLANASDAWSLDTARKERAQAKLVDTFPPPSGILEKYRFRINAIIDRCHELEIEPVFATQPVLWDADLPKSLEERLWMGKMRSEGEYLSVPRLRELMDKFNDVLIETCRERDALLIDLSFLNGSAEAFLDDCHFTAYGAELAAHRIADALLKQFEDSTRTARLTAN